jgi:hypothetical protein
MLRWWVTPLRVSPKSRRTRPTQLQKLAIEIAEQDDKLMNFALNNAKT